MWAGQRQRPAGYGRRRHDAPEVVSHEHIAVLTPEMFSTVKKRRKILPSGAVKRNSTYGLYTLDKPFRFFCTASGRWVVADEVAFDEKMGTFQSVKEYQRAVRPRNGQSQEVNFWPQLGVGETRYNTLTAVPHAAHQNPASAFVYTEESKPPPMPMAQPQPVAQAMAPPPVPAANMMPPPRPVPVAAPNLPMAVPHNLPMSQIDDIRRQEAEMAKIPAIIPDTATTADGKSLFEGSTVDGRSERGGSVFGDDKTSIFGGGDGNTDMASAVDAEELYERDRVQEERISKVVAVAGVPRHRAQSALNEYDTMESVPKRGSTAYSSWMTEFAGKHGFKPDILLKAFPRK